MEKYERFQKAARPADREGWGKRWEMKVGTTRRSAPFMTPHLPASSRSIKKKQRTAADAMSAWGISLGTIDLGDAISGEGFSCRLADGSPRNIRVLLWGGG